MQTIGNFQSVQDFSNQHPEKQMQKRFVVNGDCVEFLGVFEHTNFAGAWLVPGMGTVSKDMAFESSEEANHLLLNNLTCEKQGLEKRLKTVQNKIAEIDCAGTEQAKRV